MTSGRELPLTLEDSFGSERVGGAWLLLAGTGLTLKDSSFVGFACLPCTAI